MLVGFMFTAYTIFAKMSNRTAESGASAGRSLWRIWRSIAVPSLYLVPPDEEFYTVNPVVVAAKVDGSISGYNLELGVADSAIMTAMATLITGLWVYDRGRKTRAQAGY